MSRKASSARVKGSGGTSDGGDGLTTRYLEEVRAAYEGELLGRSFFCEMADQHQHDLYARRAFWVLSTLELEVGRVIRSLLLRHHVKLNPSEVFAKRGRDIALSLESLTWDQKLVEMTRRIDLANVRFEALRRVTPEADREVIELLVEHEIALASFAKQGASRRNDALKDAISCLRRSRRLALEAA